MFFLSLSVAHLYLCVLPHSFPPRRSSALRHDALLPGDAVEREGEHPERVQRPDLREAGPGRAARRRHQAGGKDAVGHSAGGPGLRSEEHTSELKSLMRTSYVIFCLKKKSTEITTSHS